MWELQDANWMSLRNGLHLVVVELDSCSLSRVKHFLTASRRQPCAVQTSECEPCLLSPSNDRWDCHGQLPVCICSKLYFAASYARTSVSAVADCGRRLWYLDGHHTVWRKECKEFLNVLSNWILKTAIAPIIKHLESCSKSPWRPESSFIELILPWGLELGSWCNTYCISRSVANSLTRNFSTYSAFASCTELFQTKASATSWQLSESVGFFFPGIRMISRLHSRRISSHQ